jgi:peroxiredoxin
MIEEGEQAPDFRLPAVVDGERREVGLADHLEGNVVVLGFYPGDFNPACDGESTDLDELDLFTMQKDVAVLGISGDSVHSHRAFAAEYDLHVPLLADVHGEVTGAYGVAADDPGYLTRRAVVVVDPEGVVRYAWAADSLEGLPDVDRVRAAVEGVGGGGMALARYRVGHAHYVEGRRAFSSAMGGFEDREWLLAKGDFARAAEEFAGAADTFDTAARFADGDGHEAYYERAGRKAEELSRAAEWLAESAGAFASGEGREGEQLRADAETPLETARDIPDPVPPDEFPPEDLPEEGAAGRGPEDPAAPVGGAEGGAGSAVEGGSGGPDPGSDPTAGIPADGDPASGADTAAAGAFTRSAGSDGGGADGERGDGSEGADHDDPDRIDDAELAEIAAELEEQSRTDADTDGPGGSEGSGGTGAVEGEVDLDLSEPADGDGGTGSHAPEAAGNGTDGEHESAGDDGSA